MYGHTYSNRTEQPGKVVNPARGQLTRAGKMNVSLSPVAPENLVSRDGFGSSVSTGLLSSSAAAPFI